MGMYDEITCAMPLPDSGFAADTVFQTKDTDSQFLDKYRIEADGRLVHEAYDLEFTEPDDSLQGVERISGVMKRMNMRDEVVPFHGDIRFYNYIDKVFHEFIARFTEGTCVRIWKTDRN